MDIIFVQKLIYRLFTIQSWYMEGSVKKFKTSAILFHCRITISCFGMKLKLSLSKTMAIYSGSLK